MHEIAISGERGDTSLTPEIPPPPSHKSIMPSVQQGRDRLNPGIECYLIQLSVIFMLSLYLFLKSKALLISHSYILFTHLTKSIHNLWSPIFSFVKTTDSNFTTVFKSERFFGHRRSLLLIRYLSSLDWKMVVTCHCCRALHGDEVGVGLLV